VMVTFVFLRRFSATLIPSVTVPLSLIGTFHLPGPWKSHCGPMFARQARLSDSAAFTTATA